MKHTPALWSLCAAIAFASCQKEIQKTNNQASENTSLRSADGAGDVYTASNANDDNKVYHYIRASDGTLSLEGKYSTGGKGATFALGSQGSVTLSDDKNWLFVVNAFSNEISVFDVSGGVPGLVNKISSHGIAPVSIAVHGSWLYVLNAGADFKGSIAGFTIGANGALTYIQNSSNTLGNTAVKPAQISFNNDGTVLIITEKAGYVVTYTLNAQGMPGNKQVTASAGSEPFGFAIDNADNIYVSEASHGVEGKSSVSSYSINNSGNVNVIQPQQPNHQTASCWTVLTGDYKYGYVTNTGSNTITGYSINNGNFNLLTSDGITAATGLAPQDEAFSSDSKYLYVLNQGDKTIGMYAVNGSTGALSKIGDIGGLHHKSQGLAAK
jgi:6-phosphogluconolactonase